MASRFCTVCGAVLRDGVCPRGHPQRAARRRPERPRRRGPILALLLTLLLGAAAYVALFLYPERAAGDLLRPSSQEFAGALQGYRGVVQAVPPDGTDPEAVSSAVGALLEETDDARAVVTRAQSALEAREPVGWPVVSGRPPLDDAARIRDRMLSFYTGALELAADLENVSGYLTELGTALPLIDNLEQALGRPNGAEGTDQIVASAAPITEQLLADLEAQVPPEELGSLHESLLAIADTIRQDLEEAEASNQPGAEPVVAALLDDARDELETFRTTVATSFDTALGAGIGEQIRRLDRQAGRVIADLGAVRDDYGLTGLTIPSAP
jgi:hypothetical protein